MDNKELKRIYRIEAPGLENVISKVKQLSQELELQKAIKKEADKAFGAASSEYNEAVKQQERLTKATREQGAATNETSLKWTEFIKGKMGPYMKELGSHAAAMKKISEEWEKYKNSGVQSSRTTKDYTEVIKRASAEMEKQSRISASAEVAQKKLTAEKRIAIREGEALIKTEERLKNAEITQAAAATHAAGSINAAAASYKALLALAKAADPDGLINWQGEQIGIDKAKLKLNEYRKSVDDFNRSLSPDGTLVGEYRKGIINAFADLGLTEMLKDQKFLIEQQISDIINKNRQLVAAFNEVGDAGPRGMGRIPPEFDRNIRRAEELERQLKDINEVLDKQGTIGSNVTKSIGQGFKQMINAGAGIFGITVGLQQVTNLIQKSFGTNLKIDSFNNALKLVSKTELELTKNQDFLAEETERLGLEILGTTTAFKNFYTAATQSGIGANSTREIFTAIASSAAQLKLSQEDVNGVFTAFGQIASKGKVQAEELRGQIGERIPGAFSLAARAIGVTEQELDKMMERGEVIAQEFLPKFAAEMQKTFGGDITEQIEGLQAATNHFQNALTKLYQSDKMKSFYTSILEGATEVLSFFNDGEESVKDMGKEIQRTTAKAENYQEKLGPLLKRYDELKSRTNLNVEEQEELRSIIDQVTNLFPGATTEVDAYGRALDFNRGKVLEFVDAHSKLANAMRTSTLKELKEQVTKDIETNNKLVQTINKGFIEERSVGTGGVGGGGSNTFRISLTDKEGGITEKGKEVAAQQTEVLKRIRETATAIIQSGGKLEGSLLTFIQNSGDYKLKTLQAIQEINLQIENKTAEAQQAFVKGDEAKRVKLAEEIKKLREERNKLLDPTSIDPPKKGTVDEDELKRKAKEALDKKLREVDYEHLLEQKDLYNKFFIDQSISEEEYQEGLYEIQYKANARKMEFIKQSYVGEKEQIAQLQLDQLKVQKEFYDTLFKIRVDSLKLFRDQQEDAARAEADIILNDVNATGKQKAETAVRLQEQLISIQSNFNIGMDALEQDFKNRSLENERERANKIKELRKELKEDLVELAMEGFNEELNAIDTQETKAIADRALKLRSEVQKILDSNASSGKKTAQLDKTKDNASIELLDIGIDADKRRLEIFKKMLAEKKISQMDYDRFLEQLTNKQIEREEKNAKISIDIEKQKQEAKEMIIESAQDLVNEIIEGYFSANEARIDREKDVAVERLENERKQVLAQAQSSAEKEAIDKEYDSRRAQLEKQASDRVKKMKKAEAQVALATELANIAAAAANPAANIATYGAYAALYYGLQSALAYARYAMRVKEINNTQFEYGGMPKKGGRIGGKSHAEGGTPFMFGGESYEAEVNELAIIRTKNAPKSGKFTISGTQEQIASALNAIGGGVNFRPGAKYRRLEYGGSLGANLKAPVNPSSFLNSNSNDLSALAAMVASTQNAIMDLAQQTNNRIDRIEVVQDPRAAMRAQSKIVNNNNLASL